ncbi:MAG: cupredoxin domain-containing protein [Candidatus Limnocylindria bacterium]
MNIPSLALRRGASLSIAMLMAVALVACSDDGGDASEPADEGGGTVAVSGGAVEITAADLEFDANTIEAPAGETWTITLVNNDTAPHNISIFSEEGGDEIVIGDTVNGGETVEVEVPALDAGEYYFQCDIHPDMNGTVVVG